MKRLLTCALCCLVFGVAQAQFENAQKGDIIDIGGTKAIVFYTDGNGHGSAMSIIALRGREKAWASKMNYANSIPAYSETDGMANTQAVYEYARTNGIALSEFPAFEWCSNLGPGWYIPSIKQMEAFVNFFLGNDQEYDWDTDDEFGMDARNITPKDINDRIIEEGGIPFISNVISRSFVSMGVYTSTKNNDNKVYVYEMNPDKNVWVFKDYAPTAVGKYTMGRAFYDF